MEAIKVQCDYHEFEGVSHLCRREAKLISLPHGDTYFMCLRHATLACAKVLQRMFNN